MPEPDSERCLADLTALRAIGARGHGVVRPAFSPDDVAARLWLADRFAAEGLDPVIDAAGNVWGLGGRLLLGSHVDTQPEGGWLDGAFGVLAGLAVARALPGRVSVVAFQDEEGRFGVCTGSEIWAGARSPAAADRLTDPDGLSFGDARRALPATGAAPAPGRFDGYVEAHIEQGPVLDAAGEALGVVTAIVGLRQLTATLTGAQNHAGTTPMPARRDALAGLCAARAALASGLCPVVGDASVWTIGRVDLHPNAASIVPGRATFTVQWRDPDADRLDRMEATIRGALAASARAEGLGLELTGTAALPPCPMDARCRDALRRAARITAPGRWREMPSGALHDATNVARVLPVGMLFVPSIGGVSHDFAEDTRPADLALGVRALYHAARELTEAP